MGRLRFAQLSEFREPRFRNAVVVAPYPGTTARQGALVVGIIKRAWIPLLIVVVVALAVTVVYRMHGFFGSNNEITRPGAGLAQDAEPFNPKVVTYEITGVSGAVATINYLDLDASPQRVDDASLPWSITLRTTKPSASATIITAP